jgi:oligogalacturonide transport system substrate-binding protein
MEENKELYNIMIPAMESEAIIDAFKQTADAYIYNVQDRDTTVEQIYDAVLELTK